MKTFQMYDEQASSINVEDITNDDDNRIILDRIMRNDGDTKKLFIQDMRYDANDLVYVPKSSVDMGWLGYFIGKNNHLEVLYIRGCDNVSFEAFEQFLVGISHNKSITSLDLDSMDLFDGKTFTMLGPFFGNNKKLGTLTIRECDEWGDDDEGSRLLALALGSCSLTKLFLTNNDLECVDIITALSMHPHLQEIDFEDNRLGRNGCIALATLLEHSVPHLQVLDIGGNQIDDEGIDVLVPALKTCRNLEILRLYSCPSITAKGWQKFASILESPISRITDLNLLNNHVLGSSGEALASFAKALVNNHRLKTLSITGMSSEGETERAFSKLLCDTSSITSTFLSNHTLNCMGDMAHGVSHGAGVSLLRLLSLNQRDDKKEVIMIKILQKHNNFDMTPFFEWEFKVLPVMINWFERALAIDMPEDYEPNIGPRKLSSIYQFVRGMPLLYVETYLMKELEDIKAARKQKQEELVVLEERQKSIMKRLGQQRGASA